MNQKVIPSQRPLLLILVGVLLILILTVCSPNDQLIYGDQVAAGDTIENNLVLSGNDVTVAGDVTGDLFAAGRNISVDGNVGGSLYTAGETIEVNGDVGGNIYSAALNLELGEEAALEKSLYFAGVRLSTLQGSSIGWDLVALTLGANLSGDVGRSTRATIGLVEIVNIVLEQLDTRFNVPNVPRLFPDSSSSLEEWFTNLPKQSAGLGAAAAGLGNIFDRANPSPPAQTGGVDTEALQDTLIPRLKNFVILLLLGGLVLWLIPNRFLAWTDEGRQHPWAATGYGFVIAIVGYVGFGFIALLLLALVIGIIVAGFWQQAVLFGLLTFSSLGLVSGIYLLFVYYGSKLIFSYLLGWLIIKRLSPTGNRYRMLTLILGLLIYEVGRAIPYFGIVLAAVVTFFGLGAAWMAFQKIRRGEISPDTPPEEFDKAQLESPETAGDDDHAAEDSADENGDPEDTEAGEKEAPTEETPEEIGETSEEEAEPPKTTTRRTCKKS